MANVNSIIRCVYFVSTVSGDFTVGPTKGDFYWLNGII